MYEALKICILLIISLVLNDASMRGTMSIALLNAQCLRKISLLSVCLACPVINVTNTNFLPFLPYLT